MTLKEIRIDRQACYGGTIIGNHYHKLLQDNNIDILCKSIPLIILKEVGEGDIYVNAVDYSEKYKTLLYMYAKCHFIFNSARILSSDIISSSTLHICLVQILFHLQLCTYASFRYYFIFNSAHMLRSDIISSSTLHICLVQILFHLQLCTYA